MMQKRDLVAIHKLVCNGKASILIYHLTNAEKNVPSLGNQDGAIEGKKMTARAEGTANKCVTI